MMNNMYPNGYAMPMGAGYPQPAAQQTGGNTNWLSPDKVARLKKDNTQFSLSVSDEELLRGQCNHYNSDRTSALVENPDGSYTCSICGDSFNVHTGTTEDVKNAVQLVLDYMNTCKTSYLSLSPDAALTYFQIIPFLKKFPDLYDLAIKDYAKHNNINPMQAQNGMNTFAMYANLINSPMYAQPGMMGGMPMGGYPQQPCAYATPVQQPVMNTNMPQQPGYNPMYAQPMQPAAPVQQPAAQTGYQPAQTGYAFNPQGPAQPINTNMPQQPAPAAAPQAPAAQPAVTEAVKVPETFQK